MGKKYENWVDANGKKREAEMNQNVANGGSTKGHMESTIEDTLIARVVERDAYSKWREDPQG